MPVPSFGHNEFQLPRNLNMSSLPTPLKTNDMSQYQMPGSNMYDFTPKNNYGYNPNMYMPQMMMSSGYGNKMLPT